MANFFIDRPIFAWVLAILLCLTGTLAILSLPVEQYPDLAARKVDVSLRYGKSNMINYTISLISPRLPERLALKWHRLCNNKKMCI